MLPHYATAPQSARPAADDTMPVRFGVGIDTSRYGQYAVFLRDDLQPAAADLQFAESASGYAQFRQRLQRIAQCHSLVTFSIRLDAAGQYADNLLHFLHQLSQPSAQNTFSIPNAHITVSCGDPQRNKNYRAALFGSKKSDPIEARAAARFALSERPAHTPPLAVELRTLRQVAGRLQAVVRQRTRLINQFHHLLALAFPELALLVKDISIGWVLELVHRYPTAALLAAATPTDLGNIPYFPDDRSDALLEHARTSIASLTGPDVEELIRDQVRQLRDVRARQKRLENLLIQAYRRLPTPNHLDTIPGIGEVTAAVLTAFILDIHRFDTPNKLVAYFGVLPIEMSSGIDRDGQPRGPRRYVMSKRGNDLVRRYLWMAALSAIRCNPAVRALYARVVAKQPKKKAIAVGHAMRKLLHLAFALWQTGKAFDAKHYAWEKPEQAADDAGDSQVSVNTTARAEGDIAMSVEEQTAGHKPARTVVTAACPDTVPPEASVGEATFIDFAHLKKQLALAQVLDHLGLSARLRGNGPQRRGACPIHRGDGRGRTFSVNLDDHVFQCFDKTCGKKGDVIDLWAALHGQSLRAAALDLVQTFHLEPAPRAGTEKRKG
jgi:transposase